MSTKDALYVVFGVTGLQGGSVAKSLLDLGATRVRGLTRHASSDKAKKLSSSFQKHLEIVQCDMDNEGDLKRALEGAYGVFLVTNFWEHFDANKEVEQVKRVARVAAECGVKHLVFSTLEDTSKMEDAPEVKDGFKTPHFDGKAVATEYLKKEYADGTTLGVTNLYTSFYYENFINFGMAPKLNGAEDGIYRFGMPIGDKPLPMMYMGDFGKAGAAVMMDDSTIGTSIGFASSHMTGEEIARVFAEVTGKKVEFVPFTRDQYAGLGFPGCEDLANMFKYKHDFNDSFCETRDLKKSAALVGESSSSLTGLQSWLTDNKDAIIAAMEG
jgi:nucleoside-diphosphate-sugar epimerase